MLEQAGLHLKVERGNRVFPESDKSSDVISALSALLRQAGSQGAPESEGGGTGGGGRACAKGYGAAAGYRQPDRVIVATGGLSYPATGSTGDGLEWAADSGHKTYGAVTRPWFPLR